MLTFYKPVFHSETPLFLITSLVVSPLGEFTASLSTHHVQSIKRKVEC